MGNRFHNIQVRVSLQFASARKHLRLSRALNVAFFAENIKNTRKWALLAT